MYRKTIKKRILFNRTRKMKGGDRESSLIYNKLNNMGFTWLLTRPDGNCFFYAIENWLTLTNHPHKNLTYNDIRQKTIKEMKKPENIDEILEKVTDDTIIKYYKKYKNKGTLKKVIEKSYKNVIGKSKLSDENKNEISSQYNIQIQQLITEDVKKEYILSQISELEKDGAWNLFIGDAVPLMTAKALGIQISIYEWNSDDEEFNPKPIIAYPIHIKNNTNLDESVPNINIIHTFKGHYDLLMPFGFCVKYYNSNSNSNNNNNSNSNSNK
jgi:hypothetical protein